MFLRISGVFQGTLGGPRGVSGLFQWVSGDFRNVARGFTWFQERSMEFIMDFRAVPRCFTYVSGVPGCCKGVSVMFQEHSMRFHRRSKGCQEVPGGFSGVLGDFRAFNWHFVTFQGYRCVSGSFSRIHGVSRVFYRIYPCYHLKP